MFCYQPAVRSELLKDISRIVVKLGTGVLTDSRKQPDPAQLEQLVAQLAEQRKRQTEKWKQFQRELEPGLSQLAKAFKGLFS